jgi:hypothetical protein
MLHPHADWQRPRPPHSAPSTPRTRHTRRTRPVAHCRAESGSVGCMADILCCDLDCRTILGHWYWYWYWYWYVYSRTGSYSLSLNRAGRRTTVRTTAASQHRAQQRTAVAGRPPCSCWLAAGSLQPAASHPSSQPLSPGPQTRPRGKQPAPGAGRPPPFVCRARSCWGAAQLSATATCCGYCGCAAAAAPAGAPVQRRA